MTNPLKLIRGENDIAQSRRQGDAPAAMSEPEKKKLKSSEAAPSQVAKSAAPAPLDEDKIDAPSRQTLIVLAVLSISTLVFWAAGRAACNYSVPGESLTPRKVSLEERTRTPKHVGLELAQVLSGGDFETAEKLAVGAALEAVKKQKAACGSCDELKAQRDSLKSVATVLRANSVDALVQVKTYGGKKGEEVRFFGIQREERKWRAVQILDSAEGYELKAPPVRPGTSPLGQVKMEVEADEPDGDADSADQEAEEQGAEPQDGSSDLE